MILAVDSWVTLRRRNKEGFFLSMYIVDIPFPSPIPPRTNTGWGERLVKNHEHQPNHGESIFVVKGWGEDHEEDHPEPQLILASPSHPSSAKKLQPDKNQRFCDPSTWLLRGSIIPRSIPIYCRDHHQAQHLSLSLSPTSPRLLVSSNITITPALQNRDVEIDFSTLLPPGPVCRLGALWSTEAGIQTQTFAPRHPGLCATQAFRKSAMWHTVWRSLVARAAIFDR